MYSKEAYAIDLNSLIPELEKTIHSKELDENTEINKQEYIEKLRYSATYLKEIRGYTDEPYFIVKHTEPSFYFWLAFYLSITKPHFIALILDKYFNEIGDHNLFVNEVQFKLLSIIDKNIFYDTNDQLKEITNWIREKSKIQHSEDKTSDDSVDSPEISLIKNPYGKLLFDQLKAYCEANSVTNLGKLFENKKITKPVILNSNFKKISLIRPIKELIVRGFITMNQKDASKWISENFLIRRFDKLDTFSFQSTEKVMAKLHTESKNAQIKYEIWFK